MIVEILPLDGIGSGVPIRIGAAQIVIRHDNGTPLGVAAHYGPNNSLAFASIAFDEHDFNRFLRLLGVNETVVVANTLRTSPPEAGAQLLVPPSS